MPVALARTPLNPRKPEAFRALAPRLHHSVALIPVKNLRFLVAKMACVGRAMSRSFLSTSRSALRQCKTTASEAVGGSIKGRSPCAPSPAPSPSPSSFFQTRRPASYIFRLPGEVACMQSLLPLHSATASSRLVAQLSTTAGALFQDDEDDT